MVKKAAFLLFLLYPASPFYGASTAPALVVPKAHPPIPNRTKRTADELRRNTQISNLRLVDAPLWSSSNAPETTARYKCFTKLKGYDRYEYIKRNSDKKPIMFYQHGRGIAFTLGHKERLVLINDYLASKGNQVNISDLETGKHWRIDKKVLANYFGTSFTKHVSKQDRYEVQFWTLPTAIGFSPDDTKVLIHMENEGFQKAPEENERLSKIYHDWSYVVNPNTREILGVYHTRKIPNDWWELEKYSKLIKKAK